jgi:hypothetical protein
MRPPQFLIPFVAAALGASAFARGGALFDVTLAAFADEASGSDFSLDARLVPSAWWTLSAGVGRSESSDNFADLGGTALRAAADLHGENLGLSISYNGWDDGDSFESRTLGARVYYRQGGFQGGLIVEERNIDVSYSFSVLGRAISTSQDFGGEGFGATLSYYGDQWGGYLRGVSYSYDENLSRLLTAVGQPNVTRFPRIAALSASLLTRAAGVLQSDVSAGIDRAFVRSGLRLDASFAKDAITGADSTGASVSYRYRISSRVEIEGTLGVTDTDGFDSLTYGGVALSLRN